MSRRLLDSVPFRFMQWRFGLDGEDHRTERELERTLVRTIDECEERPIVREVGCLRVIGLDTAIRKDRARLRSELAGGGAERHADRHIRWPIDR